MQHAPRSAGARRLALAAALTLGVSGTLACGGEKRSTEAASNEERVNGLTRAQASEVLAKIGDRTITLGDFAARLAEQSPYLRARYNSPERRRELLDDMIRFELLVQEAKRLGLDSSRAVRRVETEALVAELLRADVDSQLTRESITEAEARAFYDAHGTEWNQPEQVRASHIRVADRAAAQRALNTLRAAPADDELFRRIAREQSNDEATRNIGGDLRFFSRPGEGQEDPGAPPASVVQAAFALTSTGALAPSVIASADGFHIVKLTARRQAMSRTFEEVKPMIIDRLYREKREARVAELVARLRREGNVEEDSAALATVRIDPSATAPGLPEERQ